MKIIPTSLPGVVLIEPQVFGDARGYFMELFHRDRYETAGLPGNFVQDNVSRSTRGVLRGLHFQHPHAQGKLVYVLEGEVFDVAVDIRRGSPHFGKWVGATISADNKRQLFVPPGFAHGFCVTSPYAIFAYKCTELYDPPSDRGIRWNDPAIGVRWPIEDPVISDKDRKAPLLAEMDRELLPEYRGSRS